MVRNFIILSVLILSFSANAQTNNSVKNVKQIVRKVYEYFENEDLKNLSKLIADDFKFSDPTAQVRLNGKMEALDYLKSVFGVQSDLKVKIKKLYALTDQVVLVKGLWKSKLNGKEVRLPFITIFILDSQRMIKSQTDHFNLQDLLN